MAKSKCILIDPVEALRPHLDAGVITVKQLAMWAGLSEPTIYSYLACATERGPHARTVALWMQRAPRAVRMDLAHSLLAGTGMVAQADDDERDTDINRDGRTDHRDMVGQATVVTGTAQQVLDTVWRAVQDGRITDAELAEVGHQINQLVNEANHGLRVATEMRRRVG